MVRAPALHGRKRRPRPQLTGLAAQDQKGARGGSAPALARPGARTDVGRPDPVGLAVVPPGGGRLEAPAGRWPALQCPEPSASGRAAKHPGRLCRPTGPRAGHAVCGARWRGSGGTTGLWWVELQHQSHQPALEFARSGGGDWTPVLRPKRRSGPEGRAAGPGAGRGGGGCTVAAHGPLHRFDVGAAGGGPGPDRSADDGRPDGVGPDPGGVRGHRRAVAAPALPASPAHEPRRSQAGTQGDRGLTGNQGAPTCPHA